MGQWRVELSHNGVIQQGSNLGIAPATPSVPAYIVFYSMKEPSPPPPPVQVTVGATVGPDEIFTVSTSLYSASTYPCGQDSQGNPRMCGQFTHVAAAGSQTVDTFTAVRQPFSDMVVSSWIVVSPGNPVIKHKSSLEIGIDFIQFQAVSNKIVRIDGVHPSMDGDFSFSDQGYTGDACRLDKQTLAGKIAYGTVVVGFTAERK